MTIIVISKLADRQLGKLPHNVAAKLQYWIHLVEAYGISYARRIPGFHDEPLKGKRSGQRSIRLNRSYRAIYNDTEYREDIYITVIEVNKHDY